MFIKAAVYADGAENPAGVAVSMENLPGSVMRYAARVVNNSG